MKTWIRFLATLCLAVCSLAAQADTLRVTISADFQLPPLSPDPGTLSLDFSVSEPLTGVVTQGDGAFFVSNLAVNAIFNGSATTSLVNSVGWFAYTDPEYLGLDIRMSSLLVPGDLMQLILVTPVSLFSSGTVAPTLERLSLSELSGAICYYGTGSGVCTADGPMTNGGYAVSEVPEPHAAWLLSVGLLLLSGARRPGPHG